jgi:hypothetical protein
MEATRMSLADAGKALGIATNSVRSRWKAGHLRGERDNSGKVWVWIDEASKSSRSKPSSKGSIEGEASALRDVISTLREELVQVRSERDLLADRAAAAERLTGELEVLRVTHAEVSADRDHWRDQAQHLVAAMSPPVDEIADPTPRGWWPFRRR